VAHFDGHRDVGCDKRPVELERLDVFKLEYAICGARDFDQDCGGGPTLRGLADLAGDRACGLENVPLGAKRRRAPGDLGLAPSGAGLAELALTWATREPVTEVRVAEDPYISITSSPPNWAAALRTATNVCAASLI
jgi:hypothetical protein